MCHGAQTEVRGQLLEITSLHLPWIPGIKVGALGTQQVLYPLNHLAGHGPALKLFQKRNGVHIQLEKSSVLEQTIKWPHTGQVTESAKCVGLFLAQIQ